LRCKGLGLCGSLIRLGLNSIGCKQSFRASPPAKPDYYPIRVEGALYSGSRSQTGMGTRSDPALEGFLVKKKNKIKNKNCLLFISNHLKKKEENVPLHTKYSRIIS